jgi:hypothetical protein
MPVFKPVLFLLSVYAALCAPGALAAASQYAGQETREIKALSESEVAGLLAGKGMGYAKAAELNGYPGPAHVLELATELRLSSEQAMKTRAIRQRMEAEAKAAGASLVEAEGAVEMLFRHRMATPERLAESLARVGALQAKVREAHLTAHIEQVQVLSSEQIALYNRLRGYSGGSQAVQHERPHSGHRHE